MKVIRILYTQTFVLKLPPILIDFDFMPRLISHFLKKSKYIQKFLKKSIFSFLLDIPLGNFACKNIQSV